MDPKGRYLFLMADVADRIHHASSRVIGPEGEFEGIARMIAEIDLAMDGIEEARSILHKMKNPARTQFEARGMSSQSGGTGQDFP